ncbi:MAG: segregation/condensation protein A [Bacillota bacterium]|nr:segregation/condensation protein A [Bacillota bacterium]
MENVQFKLEVFEGPLDLLMHLIDKNKVNICDIPIAEILDQFMAYVEEYQNYNLDNISEFLVMAAQLLYIKSRMLLPVEDTGEGEDPRDELIDMISRYRLYKEAAVTLKEYKSQNGDRIFVKEPELVEFDETYNKSHSIWQLLDAYRGMFRKNQRRMPPPIQSFSGIVGTPHVSVSSRVFNLLRHLLKRKYISFKSFIYSQKSRSEVVAAFLAILELSKVKRIRFEEVSAEGFSDIRIELSDEKRGN